MAKRPAKGPASKAKARVKPSASKGLKGAGARTPAKAKARSAATKKRAGAAPQAKRAPDTAPPSTDIRRAYKSRLLAGYIGTHGADSIPSAKK